MRLFIVLVLTAFMPCLARGDLYTSADLVIESLRKYNFTEDPEGLTRLLTIEEPRQPEERAKMVFPLMVKDAQLLWKSDHEALAWITARPATEFAPTETGALLLLSQTGTGWCIATKIPFSAVGQYADIRFEFTGGDHSPPPIVTVTTSNGGRGASYRASATYELRNGAIFRKDP